MSLFEKWLSLLYIKNISHKPPPPHMPFSVFPDPISMASATLDPFDCLKHWVGTKFISKNCTKRNFWWNYKFIFFPGLPINSIQNCSVSTKMNMFGLHYTGTVPNIRVIDVNPQISIWYIYPCIYPSLFAAHIQYTVYTVYCIYWVYL